MNMQIVISNKSIMLILERSFDGRTIYSLVVRKKVDIAWRYKAKV